MKINSVSVDLHGYSVEDALAKANSDINEAYFNKINEVIWITGTGKINKSLLELVRNNCLVGSVLNDGVVGHIYNGLVVIELSTIQGN